MFGTLKNHIYLYGLPSYIASTDHQPLLPLYETTKTDISTRILRLKLRMQGYNYHLIYEPGAHNPTDYMSQHPKASEKEINGLQVAELQLELVTNGLNHSDLPNSVTTNDLVHATRQDSTLQLLTKAVQKGYIAPTEKQLQSYKSVFQELSVEDSGIVLRVDRIVVPKALQQKVVQLAHEGHQGIVKTNQLICSTMWFPGIDAAVQEAVERCLPCQAATNTKQKEPLLPTELPTAPWLRATTDLFGPIAGGPEHVLVVQDLYSRYPAVEIVHSTSVKQYYQRWTE